MDSLEHWSGLCDSLARAGADEEVFAAVDGARRAFVGDGLATVNAYDAARSRLTRLWSSDPEAYPAGGGKDKADTPWTRQVLQRREVFVGEGDLAIASAFDDHARIRALGMHAIVNVPVLWQRQCLGTFNVLRAEPNWAPGDVARLRVLAQMLVPVLALRADRVRPP